MVTKDEVDAALLDVRKAYRLIALFQSRARDLCAEIADAFSTRMTFCVWGPSQNDRPPGSGGSPFNKWIWDFMPLYDFWVLYLPEGIDIENHNPGDWMLCVRISADSGYKPRKSEPDPREFEAAASCESVARLYIYYCTQAFQANWYYGVYNKNDEFPPDDRENSFNDGQIRTFGKKFSLSELSDGAGVRQCVDEFRSELRNTFPQMQW